MAEENLEILEEKEDFKRYLQLKDLFENDMRKKYEEEELLFLYEDNKKDLEIWLNDFERNFGRKGIKKSTEGFLRDIASGKIIKLGVLQFELLEEDSYPALSDLSTEKVKNSVILGVHIREGVDLSKEKVQESYDFAVEFFNKRFPEKKYILFTCFSWMLDPRLEGYLNENSNILNFQRDYHLIDEKDHAGLASRVFGLGIEIPEDKDLNSLEQFTKKYYEKNELKMFLGCFFRESS